MKYELKGVLPATILTKYPILQAIYSESVGLYLGLAEGKPSHKPLSVEEIMHFIVSCYHVHSPLARESSIHKRRRLALEDLGYRILTEKDIEKNPSIAELITGQNSFINRLALHFCKFEDSPAWIELCLLQDMLDDVFLTLKEESEGTDKKSANEMLKVKIGTYKDSELMRSKMASISSSLFLGDTNLANYIPSHIILEERVRLITPERIAKLSPEQVIEQLKQSVG